MKHVEAAAEGEGPTVLYYTDEQLELLVEKVKGFTTLYDLREDDWNEDVKKVIIEYFLNKSAAVLSIYFDDSTLAAALGFPAVPVKDMTYFLKDDSTDIITPENFCEVVTFGTTNDSIEGTMLSVLQNVYAPHFFNETSWPASIKNEFCTHLHTFLGYLTDLHYKLQGLTVLYIPQEGLNLSAEEASKDKDLVRRLEDVVVHWSQQIRDALSDQDQLTPAERLCPVDEYEFWIYRYKKLSGLDFQLQNKALKHICDVMLISQSTYICQFLTLAEEIKEKMQEAKSNIEFLQILKDPCDKLDKTISPADIPEIIPTLLQNVRVIWINSPYFNKREKLSSLCRSISNKVIFQCSRAVNLESIFQGNTRGGIKILESAIECCLTYKLLYTEIAKAHSEFSHIPWDLDNGSIFTLVDSFVQRCRDLIEVCEAMIIFGRMDETENVPKPRFGGARGEEFENVCEKVERLFAENLKAIIDVQQNILDVKTSSWYDDILRFRGQVKDIEMILENLIVSVFEQVVNVEEGIHALQAFHWYSKRDALCPLYNCKTVAVYKLFSEEIQGIKKYLVEEKDSCPVGLPPFAGRALMTHLKKRRLIKLMKILDDAQWLPPCGVGDEVRTQYEKLTVSMEDTVRDLYQKWYDTLGANINARLDRPLLVRSYIRPGFLEPNFPRVILNVCSEARVWERLKYEVPTVVQPVCNKWDKFKFVYERILTVVMDYNQVIEALSDEERVLFRELIKVCDKKINPGLLDLKWNTDVSDMYLSDCLLHISELQDSVDVFKKSNLKIVNICEAICKTPFIHVDTSRTYELKELDDHLSKCGKEAISQILCYHKHIEQCIEKVHEGFEEHIPLMDEHWVWYIHKMDDVIEEALKQCVRASLKIMLEALHGDRTAGPTQILKVSATLKNNTISFEPTLTSIENFIKSTCPRILTYIESIPRVDEKLHLKAATDMQPFYEAVGKDEECSQLQALIDKEIATNISLIQNYLEIWNPFRDLLEGNRAVSSVNADTGRYKEVINNVQMQESISSVYFIMINCIQLKEAIIERCQLWQDNL